jgi:spore germination protein KA
MEYMKKIYNMPTNGDINTYEFSITIKDKLKDKSVNAFIIFIDGMTDRKVIDDNILEPLMLLSNLDIKSNEKDIGTYVKKHLLTHNQTTAATEYTKVVDGINTGGCAVFVDGCETVFVCDVKGFEHRTVGRPDIELVLRGPQEGFVESLRINTSLIRRRINDKDLIVEDITVGERSKTPCSILYIKDIANDSIVNEVRRRMKNLKVDYLIDSGELEQLIEDSSAFPVPQVLATERPDRVSSLLSEGRVAIVVNGSPFALVVPITNNDLLHSAEDLYMRFPYVNLLRFIRIIAVFSSLLLPGLFIAITNFHHEMIPTDLIIAIGASRQKVPFSSVLEVLIMELAFELIREAGIRIPGPIGPTLGIIGALILGQAAVAANIVSTILILVVAITGICSFAIPSFPLGFSFRIMRFGYIALGASAGLLGIATGLFLQGLSLTNSKSFGVPFMAPFAPLTKNVFANQFTRAPIWKQEKRPDYLNPKDSNRQAKISRGWLK